MQIKKELTGDFTYRFVTDKDQTSAPAPLPAPSTANGPIPVSLPATITAKSAILEIVDKTRGNVARIPVSSGSEAPVTLNEASFKYVQTLFVSVQHDGKPVTDVLVTIADSSHKFSMAWPLKKTDNGVAQFANVPMGEPITVGVNGAGHPVVSQTNTIIPDHPADGYHWPAITVDWSDVATIAPPPSAPVAATAQPAPITTGRESRDAGSGDSQHNSDRGGGFFSSALNTVLGIGVVLLVIYGAIWSFNKGYVKTLLDKAGINTADLSAHGSHQPSPFDKPAKAPLTPITEGTADPFAAGFAPGAATGGVPIVAASGPRLVATTGAYSGGIFALAGAYSEIGRDPGNTVPLPNDTNASRRHATIAGSGTDYTVTDNGSSNGTFLNGVRVPPNTPLPLRSGDELQVGMTRFRFES